MPSNERQETITDRFQVADENGNPYRVEEITIVDAASNIACGGPCVFYRFADGRRLTAYSGGHEFRDDESGEMYARL